MSKQVNKLIVMMLACGFVLALVGCSGNPKVSRIDAAEVTDLSGDWNDTDSRLVAEEMINDSLSNRWLSNYEINHNKQPTVIVGTIRNMSHEHINVATFVTDMERALINSGKVDFVASANERDQIREERKDQEFNASDDTRKEMGKEIGADFIMTGQISTIVDAVSGKQAKFYQVDLKLIDLESNRTTWIGQKKIKKFIKNAKVRY